MNIDDAKSQLDIYGKILSGNETETQKVSLARINFLKMKIRRLMDQDNLGDINDVAADINKALLLGVAILSGAVTKQSLIDRYKSYISAQVQLYGGPDSIMDKLEANAAVLNKWLGRLTVAKTAITAAKMEDIQAIDIE